MAEEKCTVHLSLCNSILVFGTCLLHVEHKTTEAEEVVLVARVFSGSSVSFTVLKKVS